MKSSKYTIKDDFVWRTLSSFKDEVERQRIPYSLVGGVAVQARIADLLSEDGRWDIYGVPNLDSLIRPTGDFDFALDVSKNDNVSNDNLSYLFNIFISNANNFSAKQISSKSMRINQNDQSIILNCETCPEDFKGLPKFYQDIIDSSENISLRKNNSHLDIVVPKIEYMLASKATRAEEKDIFDMYNLINHSLDKKKPVDKEFIRNVLKESGKENCFEHIQRIYYELTKTQ